VSGSIPVNRIQEPPAASDGVRLLAGRLWPRGLKKEAARIGLWLRDVAPSDGLRRWFGHSPERREEFRRRDFVELDAKPETWRPILAEAQTGAVTLLFAARDVEHSNAVALREYLQGKQ
jgi:uncharacterized protein YeaO (DUF488 family)